MICSCICVHLKYYDICHNSFNKISRLNQVTILFVVSGSTICYHLLVYCSNFCRMLERIV